MSVLYRLHQVGFTYAGRPQALRGIDLEIAQGEHVAIIGANGAGKSSLLALLGGLQYAAEGEVLFDGVPLSEKTFAQDPSFSKRFRSRVGFLFQNSDTQLFCSTVLEEVAFGPLQLFSREEALEKSHALMNAFGIEKLADAPPYALSGGEKRRVALAAVLVMDPDVLLLDEPTSNLDPKTCDFLFDLLHGYMSNPAKTVVTATHDLAVTHDLAGRCVVLAQDHSIALDAPVGEALGQLGLLEQVNLISARGIRYLPHQWPGKAENQP